MSDTPPRRAAHYIDNATLAPLVRQARRRRRASDDLGRGLAAIAGGAWDRYHFTESRDDFVQDCLLHLLQRPLKKADPKRNLFGYFTTCAIRFGLNLRDKVACERRRFGQYAADLAQVAPERIPGER